MTLLNTKTMVKTQTSVMTNFDTKQGLKQGDALSVILFNLTLRKIIWEAE